MNAAQCLIQTLDAMGVTTIFGYPGGAIMPVYDALLDGRVRHILTRHEQGAALAAVGYARSSGRVGVCLATSGPGATNLVTGLADAYMDSVPIVAITGQVPTPLMGTDAFQEVDIFGITMPVVKHSFLVRRASDICGILHEAFRLAASGRPGPVLIDIPKDVARDKAEFVPPPAVAREFVPAAPESQLEVARNLLSESRRPMLYAGGGVVNADASTQLRAFVSTTGMPTVHTLKGLGALPSDDPQYLGMLGMHGLPAANYAVQECDLLIAAGARFDDRVTGKLSEFASGARVIHIDVDAAEVGKLRTPEAPVVGNLGDALNRLAMPLNIEPWRKRCELLKAEHNWNYNAPTDGVYAPALVRDLTNALNAKFPRNVVTSDVGQHQMWVAQHGRFIDSRQFLTSGGLGTMGFGLPAAIGAQLADPEAVVVNISGDGSFMMNIQELATVRRYGLPVKIVVFDNSRLGMVRQWQELFHTKRYSEVDLWDNPDFVEVARAFGIPGARIENRNEVPSAICQLLSQSGPFLLHVRIDAAANVWPLVPPEKNNTEMLKEAQA